MARRMSSSLSPSVIRQARSFPERPRHARRRRTYVLLILGLGLIAAALYAARARAASLQINLGVAGVVNCSAERADFQLTSPVRFVWRCAGGTVDHICPLLTNASFAVDSGVLTVTCLGFTELPIGAPPADLVFASGVEAL